MVVIIKSRSIIVTFLIVIVTLTTRVNANIISGSFSAVGFVPSVSSTCATPLASIATRLGSPSCSAIVASLLTDSSLFSSCASGTNGVNCFDIGSVYVQGSKSESITPAYRLQNQSSCSMCTESSGMIDDCNEVIDSIVSAAYGQEIVDIETVYGITNTTLIALINADVNEAGESCSYTDQASLQVLKYQSEILCASSNTFGHNITSAGTIAGVLDMRPLMQCGTCAVLPCLPGQLCDGSGSAKMCPESYYCPDPTKKIACPSGYFCPLGSVAPKKCRPMSGGSCSDQHNTREVIWIPLLIASLFMALILCSETLLSFLKLSRLQVKDSSTGSGSNSPRSLSAANLKTHNGGNSNAMANEGMMSFSTTVTPVSIEFENLYLQSGETLRITNVTGKIRPSRFTAILGGSGAGKTSLMNVILGREAASAGKITYRSCDKRETVGNSDGNAIPVDMLDRIVAFVPQNDIYLREMTVEELVMHSARWRLPSHLSDDKILQRVEEVLTQLGLQHLRKVQVGGGNGNTGFALSPGDRKKVNIALELVAGPNVLFLDEPTTGIDSSSALNVAHIVSNLAKSGLTCVAVIHQPRAEIFSLIDDMIILTRGGRVAYQGPVAYVLDYFGSFGLKPANVKANKTDFLIDITSKPPSKEVLDLFFKTTALPQTNEDRVISIVSSTGSSGDDLNQSGIAMGKKSGYMLAAKDDIEEAKDTENADLVQVNGSSISWADLWEAKGESFLAKKEMEDQALQREAEEAAALAIASTKTVLHIDEPRKGFFTQFLLNCYRGFLQHFKHNAFVTDAWMYLLAGTIMGIVTCGGPLLINGIPPTYIGSCPPGAELRCRAWIRFEIGPSTFLTTMMIGAMTIPCAVRTFGREKEVFAREAAVGANKFAYFLGKICSDFPFMAFNSFLFMAPMVAIAPWQSPLEKMYSLLLCITVVVSSMGYLLSFTFSDADAAVLTGVIMAILLNLFSGFVPMLGDGFIGLVMYTHWSARAIVSAELKDGQGITDIDDFNTIVPVPWQDPDFGYDCGIMILIAVILSSLTFLMLWINNQRDGSFDRLYFWRSKKSFTPPLSGITAKAINTEESSRM